MLAMQARQDVINWAGKAKAVVPGNLGAGPLFPWLYIDTILPIADLSAQRFWQARTRYKPRRNQLPTATTPSRARKSTTG